MHIKCTLWFESWLLSQTVRSRGCIFPMAGKSSTFPRVRLAGAGLWPAISGFPSFGRGFRAPVSARFFPISVSGAGRLVRLLRETGSGLTAARGQQPWSAVLSKSYFGGLEAGLREAVGRIASSHCLPSINGTGTIAAAIKKSPLLRMEPYLPLLLGPGIGQGFGKAGDRKIRSRRAIGDHRNNAG
jgi:hypothetical protein